MRRGDSLTTAGPADEPLVAGTASSKPEEQADVLYTVESDGVPGAITLLTGSPTSGLGAGARQTTLDDELYTFQFIELGVEVTVPGCS